VSVIGYLINGGIRRRFYDAKNNALIFGRSEFAWRHYIHRNCEQSQYYPHGINGRPGRKCHVEHASVKPAQAIKGAINMPGEAAILMLSIEQFGGHHWGKRQSNDARDENCAREREGEFAEERSR